MMLMGMAMVINLLLTPASSLLPILVTRRFGKGALELGWMESALGLGILTGGLILSAWGGFKKQMATSLTGVIGIGIGFALVGFVPQSGFGWAVASLFLAAVMIPLANGPIHATMQATVAPDMQGRVFTLISSMASGMAPLGLIIAGPAADALGVQTWYVIGGVSCLLMGAAGFFIKPVINIESNHHTFQVAENLEGVTVE